MTTKEKVSKKKVVSKTKAPQKKVATFSEMKAAEKKKAAGKKQAPKEMTSREKIRKYCQVVKEPQQLGCVLVYGKHQYRMNKHLDNLTLADCDKVLKNLNEQFGIEKNAAAGKPTPAKRKTVITVDPKPCECGCRGITRVGSKFLPGHDMKLKSKLRTAIKKGNTNAKAHAQKELKSRGWA